MYSQTHFKGDFWLYDVRFSLQKRGKRHGTQDYLAAQDLLYDLILKTVLQLSPILLTPRLQGGPHDSLLETLINLLSMDHCF